MLALWSPGRPTVNPAGAGGVLPATVGIGVGARSAGLGSVSYGLLGGRSPACRRGARGTRYPRLQVSAGVLATPRSVPGGLAPAVGGAVIALALPVFGLSWDVSAWGLPPSWLAERQPHAGAPKPGWVTSAPQASWARNDFSLGRGDGRRHRRGRLGRGSDWLPRSSALAYTLELAVGLLAYFAGARPVRRLLALAGTLLLAGWPRPGQGQFDPAEWTLRSGSRSTSGARPLDQQGGRHILLRRRDDAARAGLMRVKTGRDPTQAGARRADHEIAQTGLRAGPADQGDRAGSPTWRR